MDAEQVRTIARRALRETSANHLNVSLAIRRGRVWMILFSYSDEEWVVQVEETPDSTPESLSAGIAEQIQRLF